VVRDWFEPCDVWNEFFATRNTVNPCAEWVEHLAMTQARTAAVFPADVLVRQKRDDCIPVDRRACAPGCPLRFGLPDR